MFAWVKRCCQRVFGNQRSTERQLLRYRDGSGGWKRADPFRIWRELINHPEVNWDEIDPFIRAGSEPETTQAIEATCEVFGVTRWDPKTETGLIDTEILDLFNELDGFFKAAKKD